LAKQRRQHRVSIVLYIDRLHLFEIFLIVPPHQLDSVTETILTRLCEKYIELAHSRVATADLSARSAVHDRANNDPMSTSLSTFNFRFVSYFEDSTVDTDDEQQITIRRNECEASV